MGDSGSVGSLIYEKVLESQADFYNSKYYIYTFVLPSLKASQVGFSKSKWLFVIGISSFLSYPFMFFDRVPSWKFFFFISKRSFL